MLKAASLVALVVLLETGSLQAHHSLANHETRKPVRVKGTIVQINLINPHTFFYLEEKDADGQLRRWAIEGPTMRLLERRGMKNLLKVGDVIEVCGYAPKENTVWQIATPDRGPSLAGRLLTAEMLVLADGREQPWEDYGFHHCFSPGFRDSHSK